MKRKTTLAALLLLAAGLQTALAQKVVLNYTNGKTLRVAVSELKDISFEEAGDYEYVDLGLPSGTLWATMNVGANAPQEYGDYFAWGETEPKENYAWDTYKWMNTGQAAWDQVNKYTFEDGQTSACWYNEAGIFIGDGILKLKSADDAAAVAWGSKWQMPSSEQFEELFNSANTSWTWTTQDGVEGCKITGKNGNSIFLPAAGGYEGTTLQDRDSYGNAIGFYWSCSLSPTYSDFAYMSSLSGEGPLLTHINRSLGMTIRPVRSQEHEYVDLGLPSGTLWATMNVGANSPEEYGDYFAWGETKPKSTYNDDNYFDSDCNKYNNNGGLTELLPEDDAAAVNWGGSWRMPTEAQMDELQDCTREWTTQGGVNGILVTGPNGNSIFLPTAGSRWDGDLYYAGSCGYYWSSSLIHDAGAYGLYFSSDYWGWHNYAVYGGLTVRPVRVKGQ